MKEMKYLALAALAVFGMTACQDDTDPKISTATEFVLNTPPLANETLELSPEGTSKFTVSQPNYGLTLAPTYGLEISLKEDFTAIKEGTYTNIQGEEVPIPASVTIPLESQINAVLTVKQSVLATAINNMRGIGRADDYTEEDARAVYVRATSMVANQPSTFIVSNVVTLKSVKDYCAFDADAPLDVLWTPGDANGWNFDNAMQIPAASENVYKGFMAVSGNFKFTANPGWENPGNYGAGPDLNLVQAEDGTWSGDLYENGGNFSGLDAGLYYAEVNITNPGAAKDELVGNVKLTPIKTISLIGDFNGWGGDAEMTPMEGFSSWKIENVDLGDGGWKFRMNGEWTYNLGGTMDNLVPDGDNLPGSGVQTVVLDLSKLPYSARFE